MQDLTARTLRTWAVAELRSALTIIGVLVVFVPWKTPLLNAVGVLYGALSLVAAAGLLTRKRWGWRLGILGGLLGWIAAIIVVAALLFSWAYLRGIYGDFGEGAALVCLMLASVGLQVLGLYPTLKLVALLRKEVRADLGGGGAARGTAVGLLALPLIGGLGGHAVGHLSTLDPLPQAAHQEAIDLLRAAVDGGPRPATPHLEGQAVGPLPLYATLWSKGSVIARVMGEGTDMAQAVAQLADRLPPVQEPVRIQIDRVVGIGGVLAQSGPILALSIQPGVDGMRRVDGPLETVLMPTDLVARQIFGTTPLVPGIDEIRLGMDLNIANALLVGSGPIQRIRTETWVEFEGEALPVQRASVPLASPASRAQAHEQAAISAGEYVLRQLQPDGRFTYRFEPLSGEVRPNGKSYSTIRHAGTATALSLLYRHTQRPEFLAGAKTGIEWMSRVFRADCGAKGQACIVGKGKGELGTTALAAVSMLEYQRASGDPRFAGPARAMAEFLLWMQRPDGEFHHLYLADKDELHPEVREMFASEEAALALVMAHEVLGDPRYLDAARAALDYLTGPKYAAFWVGNFIYGADVWTCIAAEEAWPRLQDKAYLDFCLGYARYLRRIQYQPGAWQNTDFFGHYGFSGLLVPQAPAAAGFSEAVVSAWNLSVLHGSPAQDVREQAALALDALARDQIRPANAWMMADPVAAEGGIRRSLVEQQVRIDFVQHAAMALIRGARMP